MQDKPIDVDDELDEEFEEETKIKFPIQSVYTYRGKVSFTVPEDKRARFFTKCYNLKLTPSKLFKICFEKFLNDDEEFLQMIKKHCEKTSIHNKKYIAVRDKEDKIRKEFEENFLTDEEYLENLYDLFEMEEKG